MVWKKGESGNPGGRARGKCTATEMRALMLPHAPALVAKAVELALGGDAPSMKICIDRLIPSMKPRDLEAYPMPVVEGDSLSEKGNNVILGLTKGEITLDDATTVLNALALQARIKEAGILEERITALEKKASR